MGLSQFCARLVLVGKLRIKKIKLCPQVQKHHQIAFLCLCLPVRQMRASASLRRNSGHGAFCCRLLPSRRLGGARRDGCTQQQVWTRCLSVLCRATYRSWNDCVFGIVSYHPLTDYYLYYQCLRSTFRVHGLVTALPARRMLRHVVRPMKIKAYRTSFPF